ncbi:MAG TPA: hypothetical protein VGV37_24605 [Aliidongia sp.]|uniref:hypothetical protein n=1 Tax=Aliidongia sp. TaxID=1914230 RepID=UPI002DDDA89B|nr:hypothetical protein [Aliidongia sp.]HEV2677735.1 hypothetical protein [Aliidongia sp.]
MAIVIAALGLLASAAKADIITGTYSGTLASGSVDSLGIFAAHGTNLSGMQFSGGFTIDTAETGPAVSCSTTQPCERVKGASPSSSMTLIIDGTTFVVAGNFSAAALVSENTGTAVTTYQTVAQNSLSGKTLSGLFKDPALLGSPAALLDDANLSGAAQSAKFTVIVGGSNLEQFSVANYALKVVDDQATSVPEPSAWAMVLGGMAMLLCLARTGPRKTARA